MTTIPREAKIYKIINTLDDMIYIGSTIKRLSQRMSNHRGRARKSEQYTCKLHKHMNTLGIEHFKIILIKRFDFTTKEDLEKEEFDEIGKVARDKLLNENVVFKKRSIEHRKKVGDSQRGDKSNSWNYGSVFKRTGTSTDGFVIDSWCFSYRHEGEKQKRVQFSIKKYGEETAHQMAKDKRCEIYPEAPEL